MVVLLIESPEPQRALVSDEPEHYFHAHKQRHPGAFGFEPRPNLGDDWSAATRVMDMGSARIIAGQFSAYSVSNQGDAFCRIFIPLNKPITVETFLSKRTINPSIAFMAPMDGFRSSYPEGSASLFFNATQDALTEALRALDCDVPLEKLWTQRMQNPLPGLGDFRAQWGQTMRAMGDGVPKTELYLATHQELLLLRLASCLAGPQPSLRSAPARAQHLERAVEYVLTHYTQDLRLADVAKAAGCGVRTLQVLFQTEMMCSLTGYVAKRRLNAARARLCAPRPEDSVTSIAMDSGFSHLGEFAQSYFRTYSERPSQTLARARRPGIQSRAPSPERAVTLHRVQAD